MRGFLSFAIKGEWASLTDDNLQYSAGRQEELVGRIQKRAGRIREIIEKAVEEFRSANLS